MLGSRHIWFDVPKRPGRGRGFGPGYLLEEAVRDDSMDELAKIKTPGPDMVNANVRR